MALTAGDDARMARWFDFGELPALVFDHQEIVIKVKEYLREQFLFFLPDREMLPEQFDQGMLKDLINQITENEHISEFMVRKWSNQGIVKTDHQSKLYSFDVSAMDKIRMTGFI